MTVFFGIMAIFGWLCAIICFSLLIILSLAIGANEELEKEKTESRISTEGKRRTHVWSISKEKEIPFGD